MRVIKLGLISFVFFFLLITAFSLFIPSRVRISRAMNTGVTADSSFSRHIADLSQWKYWYPSFDSLPLVPVRTSGGRTVEARAGKTGLVLVNAGDSLIEVTFRESGKKQVTQVFRQVFHPLNDSVTIHWYMDFRLRWYPWEKFSGLMFEKRYGPQMEQGLSELRKLARK